MMSIDPKLTPSVASLSLSSQPVYPNKQEKPESLKELVDRKMPLLNKRKEWVQNVIVETKKRQSELKSQMLNYNNETSAISLELEGLIKKKSGLDKEIKQQKEVIDSILEKAKPVVVKTKKCCGDAVSIPLKENNFRGSPSNPSDLAIFSAEYSKNPAGFVSQPLYETTQSHTLERYMIDYGMVIDPVTKQDYFSYPLPNRDAQGEHQNRYSLAYDDQNDCIFFDDNPGIDLSRKFIDFAVCMEESEGLAKQLHGATVTYSQTFTDYSSCENMIKEKEERLKVLKAITSANEEGFRLTKVELGKVSTILDQIKSVKHAHEKIKECKKQNDSKGRLEAENELRLALEAVPED